MEKGKIVQILGPVIDVEFETEQLPLIHDALTVVNKGKEVVDNLLELNNVDDAVKNALFLY